MFCTQLGPSSDLDEVGSSLYASIFAVGSASAQQAATIISLDEAIQRAQKANSAFTAATTDAEVAQSQRSIAPRCAASRHRFESGPKVGVVGFGCRVDLGAAWQSEQLCQTGGDGVRRRRIGEEQYADVEPRAFCGKLGLVEVALTLLELDVATHCIGMGDLACSLALLGDGTEAVGFIACALADGKFCVRCQHAVVVGDDDGDKTAPCNPSA